MAQPENRFAQQHAETPPAILDIDKPTTAPKRFREFNEVRYFGFQTFLGGFLLNVLSIPVLQYLHCAPSPDFHALVCLVCIMGIAVTFVSIAFNRPAFLCPHCGKHVNTHIDWQCGYCDATNTDKFPGFKHKLLGGCGSCHRVALSMVCYHCATPVCLSDAQKDRWLPLLREATATMLPTTIPERRPPKYIIPPSHTRNAVSGASMKSR